MNNLKVLLIILLCSISNKISAQEIEWKNTIGGNSNDFMYSISQTNDSGYIIGGFSSSNISGDKTEICQGTYDYWVVKFDSLDSIEWQNTIGGSSTDRLYSVSQTSDGGYIIGGESTSNISGDKSENSQGGIDYWIVKLDSSGSIQWQNTIGGQNDDRLKSIIQTNTGDYIIGGYSASDISGDKTENSKGMEDYWIVKVDAFGSIVWQKTIGGSSFDALQFASQTSDGGQILGGRSNSDISGDKTEDSQGGSDYWILKLDSAGAIIWQNTIGGIELDVLTSVRQISDGGYIIGGYSGSNISGDKSEKCHGINDFWIVRLDSSGIIQWENTIGGNDFDELHSVLQTSDGGFICGGWSSSLTSGDKTENSQNSRDYWVVRLNSLGAILWQNTIGGSDVDEMSALSITPDGGFLLGGSSQSPISGDVIENSQGWDFWIIKLTEKNNLIQGTEFADLNNNTILDGFEPRLSYQKIIENNNARIAFSDQDGFYSLAVTDTGNYQVSPEAPPNYYSSLPASHNVNFSSILQIDSLNDFALQTAGIFDDLCITITPTGNFRSGMNASYMLNYTNIGTTAITGITVIFYPYANVAYVSATISPLSIAPDSVVFFIGNLSPFQSGQIIVTVSVDPGLPIGTLINSSASILPIAGDINPTCNISFREILTTGSFDPNDILVSRNFIYDSEILGQPELEYIIRFQNTGNDTAFAVKVLNPIDTTKLQLNTIEIVSVSHPVSISWIPWERNMQFQFDSILLPDSNTNEPMSHGFIRYKIKSKTNLLAGDSIINRAHIYFDFNDPVATNIAKTDIILFTGTHDAENSHYSFVLYPNPANSELTIEFNHTLQINNSLELYSVFGQKIQSFSCGNLPANSFVKTINISSLTPGIYFVKREGINSFFRKFVKY